VLEVSVRDDTDPEVLFATLDGLVGRLGGAIEPARSAAALGVDHEIMEGTGAVQLFYCLRRVPALTHEQFSDYWRNQLVKHTTKTPMKAGYRQVHADPELTIRAAKAAGVEIDDIDGVALEWYPDMPSFSTAVAWSDQPTAPSIEAETEMSDIGRAIAVLTYAPASRP
jgi:hypothetical protein